MAVRRWLFGDQLGPHFLDSTRPTARAPALLIEARGVFERRVFHRQKAHLILSAMRHRAAELGERCRYVRAATYRAGLAEVDEALSVVQPTSWSALHFVDRIATEREVERLARSRIRHLPRRLRRLGRRTGAAPAVAGGLLP